MNAQQEQHAVEAYARLRYAGGRYNFQAFVKLLRAMGFHVDEQRLRAKCRLYGLTQR